MITDALASRTISTYALSIGTSLAMESIGVGELPAYDAERVMPDPVDLSAYDGFHINLSTLYRNIIGAVGAQNIDSLNKSDLAHTLNQEIEIIKEIVKGKNPSIKLTFYVCGNEGLEKRYPHATFRQNTTAKQIAAQALLEASLSTFFTKYKNIYADGQGDVGLSYQTGTLNLGKLKKVLLMTHQAIDLLSCIHHQVDLLESHTGVLKTKAQFYTKFHDGKALVRIPFNSAMLVVFGDSQTFMPWKKAIREEVIAIAEKYRWNYMTTPTRMRINLHDLKDELAQDVILKML